MREEYRDRSRTAYTSDVDRRFTMRRSTIAAFAVLVLWSTGSAHAATPSYYLALGDSLSRGIQPGRDGVLVETDRGYVDDLYAFYSARHPGLRLAKLGCSGETTTTMIAGGSCEYASGSQLAEAVAFLQTHRVALVTLTIGGNNIDHCIGSGGIDQACVLNGVGAVAADLPRIVGTLRAAAGAGVPIVAMNYYDPFLALWRLGPAGQFVANESLQATVFFNTVLENVYLQFRVPVADVAKAFRTTDSAVVQAFDLPLNVLATLVWTWMGAAPPVGPDIHPNAFGYAVIAGAFVRTIG
jgi:lysophospholipase L1-like esterase